MSQSVPAGTPDRPPYVPTQQELTDAAANVQNLDPNGEGFGMDKMRLFYPRAGWNVIQTLLNKLVENGTLRKGSKMMPNGKVAVDHYTVIR